MPNGSLQSIFLKAEKQVHLFTINDKEIVLSLRNHSTDGYPFVCFECKCEPYFSVQPCLNCRHATAWFCLNHSAPPRNICNVLNHIEVALSIYPCKVVKSLLMTLHDLAKNEETRSSTNDVGRANKSRHTAQGNRTQEMMRKNGGSIPGSA